MDETSPSVLLQNADIIHDEASVQHAIDQLALQIFQDFKDKRPIVISVMGGAVVFAGMLLPKLNFPLEFDYVQASRYHDSTTGSNEVTWYAMPKESIRGRAVLLLDDILDEGHTLSAIKKECLTKGAAEIKIAVLVEKLLNKQKPIQADYIGLTVPDRYVFGCGMDVYGWWRNLPAIYALKNK